MNLNQYLPGVIPEPNAVNEKFTTDGYVAPFDGLKPEPERGLKNETHSGYCLSGPLDCQYLSQAREQVSVLSKADSKTDLFDYAWSYDLQLWKPAAWSDTFALDMLKQRAFYLPSVPQGE